MSNVIKLHDAVKRGDLGSIKALVEENQDLANSRSETDARGTYPLHVAAEFGQPGAARALLKYGADVSLLDSENEASRPWLGRRLFGRPEVVAVLLEAGSEPSQRNQPRPYTARLRRGRDAGQMEAVFHRDGRRVAARRRDHPFIWRRGVISLSRNGGFGAVDTLSPTSG